MLSNGPNLNLLVHGNYADENYIELLRLFRGLDLLVQPHVKSSSLTTPPLNPVDGDAYIIASPATGAWANKATRIVRWSAKLKVPGWEYFIPKKNWLFGVDDLGTSGQIMRFTGTEWVKDEATNNGDDNGVQQFIQSVPTAEWVITHEFEYPPLITVVDSGNNLVEGDVEYTDSTHVTINFGYPFSGSAYLR